MPSEGSSKATIQRYSMIRFQLFGTFYSIAVLVLFYTVCKIQYQNDPTKYCTGQRDVNKKCKAHFTLEPADKQVLSNSVCSPLAHCMTNPWQAKVINQPLSK